MIKNTLRVYKEKLPIIQYLIESFYFAKGAYINYRTGQTPKRSHYSLVVLFIKSKGKANDFLSSLISKFSPPYKIEETEGVLSPLSPQTLKSIQDKLRVDGYYIFEQRLSSEFCEKIVQKSLDFEYQLSSDELAASKQSIKGKYDPQNPIAARYQLPLDQITDMEEVQQLLCDPVLVNVAQNYLEAKPIFTGVNFYWSAIYKNVADSFSAQKFHFDMERIKWIRYFVYLTDVESFSGPHCFIQGSHRTGAIPTKFLEQGYVRLEDEDVIEHYGESSYIEFTGKKGTIIAEDSRGFHKGKAPQSGDRLLLSFELSNSTFGANKRHLIRNIHVPQFAQFYKKYPKLYLNFDFK